MRKLPRLLARFLALPCLCFGGWATAAATDSRFHIDAWGTDDGLPQNSVVSMIQTRDGYLWLGTLNGLVRFDGVQFKVFDEHNTPGLTSGRIVFLFEDSKSNLWIGTDTAGALLLRDGRITNLGFGRGSRETHLKSACQDASGAVWLGTANGELRRWHDGTMDVLPPVGRDPKLIAEKSGQVWVGSQAGLVEFDPVTTPPAAKFASGSRVDFLLAGRSGGRWLAGSDGGNDVVEKWSGGKLERWPCPYAWGDAPVSSACEDQEGNLIVGTRGAGVWWFDADGKTTRLSQTNGLSSDFVLSLQMDVSGSLWVGLDSGGLNRVERQLFHPLDAAAGLTVQSVCEDDQGGLWFSAPPREGIDYWKDGVLVEALSSPGPIKAFNPRALLMDRRKNLWAAMLTAPSGGLYLLNNGMFQQSPGDDILRSVSALHEDRAGRLWAGTQHGLACWDGQSWRAYTAADGLSAEIVRAVADDAEGNLWIGTEGGGLDRLKDGKFTAFQRSNGFPSDNISAIYVDNDGVLWAGTFGNGLIRFKSGVAAGITTDDGLTGNGVDYLIEDDQGCLWIGSNAGLMRVRKSDLNDFAAKKLGFVPCHTYGKRDGLPSGECTLGSQPAACRARDGRLWFPTIAGLASVDPSQIRPETNPMPVMIEAVFVEGQQQNTNGPHSRAPDTVVVPVGKESLDIQYTSLRLDDPQQARFRYRMAGYETRAHDAGNRRTAHYGKLPHGAYHFEVAAANEDGSWNSPGAILTVIVLPAYWQTLPFQAAAAALLLGALIALVYFISTQKLQRQLGGFRQQQALEKDRARIARDIHDQVGASLTQLSLLGELVESDKDHPDEVAAHAAQISQTSRETARALDEIVWTVNPSNDTLEGLLNYICKHAQEYLAVAGLRYRLEAPARLPAGEVSPEARHNVFLAAKESVTNVVKHAQATEVCIRLQPGANGFTLEIEDNGRGPGGVAGPAASTRNGMRNMRKRMEDIGGTFEIGPGAHGGTLVRLSAPVRPPANPPPS